MKILSIDVGMKNLAFCLFEINDSMEYIILKWDVLNLCKNQEHLCKEPKKNKDICNKKAKYFKDNCYYCKTHAKNKKYLIPNMKCNKYNLKKKKILELRKIIEKHKLEIQKKAKKDDLQKVLLEYFEQKYFDIVSKTRANQINLVTYGRNMREMFNETLENINIDIVCVENQIGPLALRMKTLQGMIMQHFIEVDCQTIEQISPSNKLKNFIGTQKTTYGERKKLGIKYTREIIIKDNSLSNWCQHFEKHKKKDDLADSFLQALWYMKNKKLIN